MFDVVVGGVRLDVWADGSGIVSRKADGRAERGLVPLDPSTSEMLPAVRAFCLVALLASVLACLGGFRLLANDETLIAAGTFAVALLIAGSAGISLVMWRAQRLRREHIRLTSAGVAQFKALAEPLRLRLRKDAATAEYKAAAEQMWELAVTLAAAEAQDPIG